MAVHAQALKLALAHSAATIGARQTPVGRSTPPLLLPCTHASFRHRTSSILRIPSIKTTRISPVRAERQVSVEGTSTADISLYKHILLPVTDQNPYLSEGTKQAVAATTSLARKNDASITVVVIDESIREAISDHDTRLNTIRWHLAQGGYEEFRLIERLGEGKKPTAIIGEVADDMNLDLVVMSMESIHTKHVDGNLLAEFIPCPVVLLPL